MTWLDWALLAVLALAAIYGFKKRATGMLAGLVVVVIGLLAARPLTGVIADNLGFVSDIRWVQLAAAYVVFIILVLVAGMALGWALERLVGFIPLGTLADRGLGAAIGLAIGLLVTGVMLSTLASIAPDIVGQFIMESRIGGFLIGPFNSLVAALGVEFPFGDADG